MDGCHTDGYPVRTRRTWLSDDALLRFDALFDCRGSLASLRRPDYSEARNAPLTRALDEVWAALTGIPLGR